ncbi:MAG: hypothetical protein R3B70_25525 [Polyangiaceae bacterium]
MSSHPPLRGRPRLPAPLLALPPALALALTLAACENTAGNCELTAECSGSPGIPTATCDPEKSDTTVPDTCGIFASPTASPGGDGTSASPFSTLAEAIEAAEKSGTRTVYACAGTFPETVTLPGDFLLHAGLDCEKGWSFDPAARTTLAPPAGIPLTIEATAGDPTRATNLAVQAPPGAAPDPPSENPLSGGSSIAALALPGAKVELVRCDLTAADGAPGATRPRPAGPPPPPATLARTPVSSPASAAKAPLTPARTPPAAAAEETEANKPHPTATPESPASPPPTEALSALARPTTPPVPPAWTASPAPLAPPAQAPSRLPLSSTHPGKAPPAPKESLAASEAEAAEAAAARPATPALAAPEVEAAAQAAAAASPEPAAAQAAAASPSSAPAPTSLSTSAR